MKSCAIARVSLWLLCLFAVTIGLTATAAPHVFYEDYPFFADWVKLLPPYNEHLVTDVGGLYLGFAVLFAWAATTLQQTLVRAVSTAWLLAEGLHLAFHATHSDGFGTADAVGQLTSLAFLLVPALIAVWAVAKPVESR